MQTRHSLWRVWLPGLALIAVLGILSASTGNAARLVSPPGGSAPPAKPTPRPPLPPPAAASQDLPFAQRLAPAVPQRRGGPDPYGYLVSDSTEVGGPVFSYVAAPTLVLTGDDNILVTTLPFPVNLYDSTTYTLTLNTNGLVYLGHCQDSTFPCSGNYPLPNPNAPAALIAPIWDDLVLTDAGSGVFTGVFGSAPARYFVIEWRNASFYEDPDSSITAEMILHENSNEIDFEYLTDAGTLGNASTATIGIQNAAQTIGLMYSYHEAVLVPSFAIRFLALITPGDQSTVSPPCSTVNYSGLVTNPFSQTVGVQLNVQDSDPSFHSVVTPTYTTVQPGGAVAFSVGLNIPAGIPISTTNVTTLAITDTNASVVQTETVHLTTQVQPAEVDFVPSSVSGTGQSGNTVTYTLSLFNRIGPSTSFHLTSSGNNWPTDVSPLDTGVIGAGGGISVTVHVQIPAGTPLGESDVLSLTATSQISGTCGFNGTATVTTFNNNQVGRHNLLEPRARHALVDFPLTGRVYQLGGVTTNNNRNVPVEEYDARSDTWLARSSLVRGVSNVGGAALGSLIYVPGGFDGTGAVNLLQTYQPTTDTAAVVGSDPLPAPRYGAGVTAVGGKLYVIGGADNISATQTVYIYNPALPAGSRWSRGADMPTARAFLGVGAVNGLIYAAGGIGNINSPVDLATLEIYNPATNTWTTGAPMTTPRGGLAVVGIDSSQPCGGYLYAFAGGWLTPLATVERYNPATDTWAAIAPLGAARRTLAATYVSNGHLLLATGGYNQSEMNLVDAVGCGGALPSPTPTPPGGAPTFTPVPACTVPFSDVHSTDYYYAAVRYLNCHGVIAGYADNTFRPFADMTRAQLAKVVVLGENWTLVHPAQGHFSDVPPSNPFYTYIETAYSQGIISGYANGTFGWGNNVTRSQIAKIIVLAQAWVLQNPSQGDFSDVPPGAAFYSYVETAFAHGILSGYGDGTFRPFTPTTRGQVSKIFYLALGSP